MARVPEQELETATAAALAPDAVQASAQAQVVELAADSTVSEAASAHRARFTRPIPNIQKKRAARSFKAAFFSR